MLKKNKLNSFIILLENLLGFLMFSIPTSKEGYV